MMSTDNNIGNRSAPILERVTHHVNYVEDAMRVVDDKGNTWLHIACENGDEGLLLNFLEKGRYLNLNIENNKAETPLILAVQQGRQKIVEILLTEGADINDGVKAPLHIVAETGQIALVNLLLERGADINKKDMTWGLTPLHFAAKGQRVEVAQVLIKAGANIQEKTAGGFTPLHTAAEHVANMYSADEPYVGSVLIKAGANCNVPNCRGNYPIHVLLLAILDAQSAQKYHNKFVYISKDAATGFLKFMVDHGADVNAPGALGETPLHLACQCGYEYKEMIQFLIERGAKVDVKNQSDDTPIRLFALRGIETGECGVKSELDAVFEITKLLIEHGAKVDKKTRGYYEVHMNREEDYYKKHRQLKKLLNKGGAGDCLVS